MGMCGPIVMAYSLQNQGSSNVNMKLTLVHHCLFHLGRLTSYCFMGLLAGLLAHLVNLKDFIGSLRATVSLLAGMAMVVMGLMLAGGVPYPGWRTKADAGSKWKPLYWIRKYTESPNFQGRFLLGAAAGFLPCMLPLAMLLQASASSGIHEAIGIMAFFGLGTMPALLFVGLFSTVLSVKLRLWGEKVASLGVIVMGGILAYKGARALFRIYGIMP